MTKPAKNLEVLKYIYPDAVAAGLGSDLAVQQNANARQQAKGLEEQMEALLRRLPSPVTLPQPPIEVVEPPTKAELRRRARVAQLREEMTRPNLARYYPLETTPKKLLR